MDESNKMEELNKVLEGFNTFTESPEVIVFKNPVLNALFNGNEDTGGLPRGTVTQIAAQSGTGKSTLALAVCRELCEQGLKVLYIDAEKGLNINMLKSTNMYKFLKSNNNPSGNFMIVRDCDCNSVNEIIRKSAPLVDFIVVDSLGSLDSNIYDIGGVDANNPKVGANAKSLKIVMMTINREAIEHNVGFICINHLAQSIGTYIPSENPVGGRAPVYLSDIIIKLTKKSSDFEKLNLGQKVEFEAIKSRFGRGKSKIPFYIRFGQGIALLPTFREVLDKVIVDYKGQQIPILEVRGGGNGSLFIDNVEYKFRGENQLNQLIQDNYAYIKKHISWKMFLPELPKAPDYFMKEPDLFAEEGKEMENNKLPEELRKIKVVEKTPSKIYFDKGIDSTGQEYSIYYDIDSELLAVDFDSNTSEMKANPTKDDYKKQKKLLTEYLKSLKA